MNGLPNGCRSCAHVKEVHLPSVTLPNGEPGRVKLLLCGIGRCSPVTRCNRCNGTGLVPWGPHVHGMNMCPVCKGSGRQENSAAPSVENQATPERGNRSTDHVVLRRDRFHCEHCGASSCVVLPCDLDELSAKADAFLAQHRGCKRQIIILNKRWSHVVLRNDRFHCYHCGFLSDSVDLVSEADLSAQSEVFLAQHRNCQVGGTPKE
jgi:hypothetical protein